MSGICGWYGEAGGNPRTIIDAMIGACAWPSATGATHISGSRFTLAAAGPPGTTMVVGSGPIHVAVQGHPHWISGVTAARGPNAIDDFCRRVISAYREGGSAFLSDVGGDFALAVVDETSGMSRLRSIGSGARNVVCEQVRDTLIFGATSDAVLAHPLAVDAIAPQACTTSISTWSRGRRP
jgi:asparagine synthase (glutamine-hydrolysing)